MVPKTQYEEAKLTSVEDSGNDDHDDDQSSCSTDEQQSITKQSNQEGQTSDDDGDDVTTCSDKLNSEGTLSEESNDESESDDECEGNETEEKLTEKITIPHHKKKLTNDVTEGRTVFIRYLHMHRMLYIHMLFPGICRLIMMKMICMTCSLSMVISVIVR